MIGKGKPVDQSARPIAIVGIGCLFPQAQNLEEYWHNIKHGIDSITDVPPSHWSVTDYFDKDPKAPDMTYAQRGGFIPEVEFDPLAFGHRSGLVRSCDGSVQRVGARLLPGRARGP